MAEKPDPEGEVKDPEDYINQRRLSDIFDTRQEVREVRLTVREFEDQRYKLLTGYRRALESYLQELYPLMTRYEPGPQYWQQIKIGVIEISPPEELETSIEGYHYTPFSPVRYELVGLRSLFEVPDPIEIDWGKKANMKSDGPISSDRREELMREAQVPQNNLDDIFLLANEFLVEMGVEAEIEEDKDNIQI